MNICSRVHSFSKGNIERKETKVPCNSTVPFFKNVEKAKRNLYILIQRDLFLLENVSFRSVL